MKRSDSGQIIESKGAQIFSVPNTIPGREFIRLLKLYKHNGKAMRIRARGSRNIGDYDTAIFRAKWFAVYLDEGSAKIAKWQEGHRIGMRVALMNERKSLEGRLDELTRLIGDAPW